MADDVCKDPRHCDAEALVSLIVNKMLMLYYTIRGERPRTTAIKKKNKASVTCCSCTLTVPYQTSSGSIKVLCVAKGLSLHILHNRPFQHCTNQIHCHLFTAALTVSSQKISTRRTSSSVTPSLLHLERSLRHPGGFGRVRAKGTSRMHPNP